MKIKFDKYHIRLRNAEHTILIPRNTSGIHWNAVGGEWGKELIGDREALYALLYACAVLTYDHNKIIYFPIKGNELNEEDFLNYKHDVVFTTYKSGLHVSDWKEYRQIIRKMTPQTYTFDYDRKRIDAHAKEVEDQDFWHYKVRERTCVGYEKDAFDTWFTALDGQAYLSGYGTLRKMADRPLENEFVKCQDYLPYETFLTYEPATRHGGSYNEKYCYGFMFYDTSLVPAMKAYMEKIRSEKKFDEKKKKLVVNEHDTTKTKSDLRNIRVARKKKTKKEVVDT